MSRAASSWQTYCGSCDTYVATDHTGACAWCGSRVRTRRGGTPWLMGEEIISKAVAAYLAGYSVPAIARALYAHTTYSSIASFIGALYVELDKRKVPRRDRSRARGDANRRRSDARRDGIDITGSQCVATTTRGDRCRRDALKQSDLCHAHHPDRLHMTYLVERRNAARATRPRYSTFAAHLDAWARQHGKSWCTIAHQRSGISPTILLSVRRTASGGRDRVLTPKNEHALRTLLNLPTTEPKETTDADEHRDHVA